ncbi:hypothetical protein OAC97_04360 [Flavobacteriaceae bacterium]|nr:hypothetical protein [Flavobacteriaceae bacterium]
MKNIIKLFSLFLVLTLTVSCGSNSGDDLGYSDQEERGWIQFPESNPDVIKALSGATGIIDLGVDIQVPTTSSDLTINYTLRSVTGLDPNTVFSNNGITVAPAGKTSYSGLDNRTGLEYSYLAPIAIDITELEGVNLTEPMIFDVVLTATSSSKITVGLTGDTFPVTQRIIVYHTIASAFAGTYSVDEVFTDGLNEGLMVSTVFGESYQVELAVMPNDSTGTKMLISTSPGFNDYFIPDTILTFMPDGTLHFDDTFDPGNPVIAYFRIMEISSSSNDFPSGQLQANGNLGEYGPYQFILTKM